MGGGGDGAGGFPEMDDMRPGGMLSYYCNDGCLTLNIKIYTSLLRTKAL